MVCGFDADESRSKDSQNFFAYPVTEEIAPKYFTIIKYTLQLLCRVRLTVVGTQWTLGQ